MKQFYMQLSALWGYQFTSGESKAGDEVSLNGIVSGDKLKQKFKYVLPFCLFSLGIFLSTTGFAQTKNDTAWELLKVVNGVEAYYRVDVCSSQNVMHLKIINLNQSTKKINWVGVIKRDGKDIIIFPSIAPTTSLKAGDIIQSDCSSATSGLTVAINSLSEVNNFKFDLIVQP